VPAKAGKPTYGGKKKAPSKAKKKPNAIERLIKFARGGYQ
jgi:hypothetical protein